MEIIEISTRLLKAIDNMSKARKELSNRAEDRANAIATYEKEMAKTIIRLKNGEEFMVGDKTIINPPITIIEKIAKGICYKDKLNMELCESRYRNILVGLKNLECEITALQSINKYLDKI